MIYFKPAYSGINSILGQAMWFKRFCDGHAVEFDLALDLDDAKRNRITESVHSLLFGEGIRANLRRNFTETIGIQTFFERVTRGTLSGTGDILVEAGLANPPDPGIWRFHAFQLHCLEQGLLSDTYPRWATGLQAWTREGRLAADTAAAAGDARPPVCLVHLRLGDCAVLTSEEASHAIGRHVPGQVIAANAVMSEDDFVLYRMGLHERYPARHYAERGARMVRISTVMDAIQRIRQRLGDRTRFILCTDGYTRTAELLARATGGNAGRIEQQLNERLNPLTSLCDEALIGEHGDDLVRTLRWIRDCDELLTSSSLFPATVRCALMGEEALQNWTCIDESDTLSQFLQLPALVPLPKTAYAARLRRLLHDELAAPADGHKP